jgi:hypothetical protein
MVQPSGKHPSPGIAISQTHSTTRRSPPAPKQTEQLLGGIGFFLESLSDQKGENLLFLQNNILARIGI